MAADAIDQAQIALESYDKLVRDGVITDEQMIDLGPRLLMRAQILATIAIAVHLERAVNAVNAWRRVLSDEEV